DAEDLIDDDVEARLEDSVTAHEGLVVAEEPIESLDRFFGTGERHEAIDRDRVFPRAPDDELIDGAERVERHPGHGEPFFGKIESAELERQKRSVRTRPAPSRPTSCATASSTVASAGASAPGMISSITILYYNINGSGRAGARSMR